LRKNAGPETFCIFDTFNDEHERSAHVNGEVAKALFARAEELFVAAPQIQMVDIVAEKTLVSVLSQSK
jgi:quinol monooxygenase YgiN